ncbi:hypothetical protein QUB37_14175 [Microcoleus sp. AT3-A2]
MFSRQSGYLSTVNRIDKGRELAPAPMRLSSQDQLKSQTSNQIAAANPVANLKLLAAPIQQIWHRAKTDTCEGQQS